MRHKPFIAAIFLWLLFSASLLFTALQAEGCSGLRNIDTHGHRATP